jgi:hypothetical protein
VFYHAREAQLMIRRCDERGVAALSLPHTKNNRASNFLVDRVSMSIPGSELSEDDITIVMDQAHVTRPLAVQALKKQG